MQKYRRSEVKLKVSGYLIGLLIFFLLSVWSCQTGNNPSRDYKFKVDQVEKIQKIILKRQDTLVLEKNKGNWILDGDQVVRENAMTNLLAAIQKIELKYIPPIKARETIRKDLGNFHTEVEIYGNDDELIQSYWIGGAAPDERGTFARSQNGHVAVVYIPNWEGSISLRYAMPKKEWFDRKVIDAFQKDWNLITLNYPEQKEHSFTIKKETHWSVEPYYPIVERLPSERYINYSIEAYLKAFAKELHAESIVDTFSARALVKDLKPFCVLTIQSQSDTMRYSFFPQQWSPTLESTLTQSVGRYWVFDEQGNAWVVQDRVFRPLFWGYSFFFRKPLND